MANPLPELINKLLNLHTLKKSNLYRYSLSFIVVYLSIITTIQAKTPKLPGIDTVRNYYALTNKAELAIVDSNFKEAIIHYEAAFRFKTPNAKDLHNAYCAAALIKDCKNGRFFLEKLAHLGYRIPETLIDNADFWDCTAKGLKVIADKVRKEFKSGSIGLQLDSLYKEDQSLRGEEKTDYEKMAKIDAAVLQSLYNILRKERFTDVETGMWYGNPGNDYSVLWLVRWHAHGGTSILDSILLENVMKGNYDPSVYASLIFLENNAKYGIFYNPGRKWTDKERKIINENREKIYLEPLEDYEKKVAMQLKTELLREKLYLLYDRDAISNNIYFRLTPNTYMAPVW